VIKRCFDLAAASAGLIAVFPVLVILAVLVRLLTGPPVFFKQTRVGKNGRKFALIKFRTMTVSPGAENGVFEPGNLGRVTRFGSWLRRYKLDELPQLINVIRGDMSIVGPRPEVPRWIRAYPDRWAIVLRVRPGITDPASLIYRNEECILAAAPDPEKAYRDEILPRKLALYEEYIGAGSFFADLTIIVKTVFSIFRDPGSRPGEK
jgi:lipopolysaccharide/colanic/teichoic acid biosynthesis glycosyltransferase